MGADHQSLRQVGTVPEPQPTEQPGRAGDFDVGDWPLGRDPGSARDASRIVLRHVAARVKVDTCTPPAMQLPLLPTGEARPSTCAAAADRKCVTVANRDTRR
jgi:hypothetical protein